MAPARGRARSWVMATSSPGRKRKDIQWEQATLQTPGRLVWNEPNYKLNIQIVPYGSELLKCWSVEGGRIKNCADQIRKTVAEWYLSLLPFLKNATFTCMAEAFRPPQEFLTKWLHNPQFFHQANQSSKRSLFKNSKPLENLALHIKHSMNNCTYGTVSQF